jgi:hypothetical protein
MCSLMCHKSSGTAFLLKINDGMILLQETIRWNDLTSRDQ